MCFAVYPHYEKIEEIKKVDRPADEDDDNLPIPDVPIFTSVPTAGPSESKKKQPAVKEAAAPPPEPKKKPTDPAPSAPDTSKVKQVLGAGNEGNPPPPNPKVTKDKMSKKRTNPDSTPVRSMPFKDPRKDELAQSPAGNTRRRLKAVQEEKTVVSQKQSKRIRERKEQEKLELEKQQLEKLVKSKKGNK